ncbi:protein kinase domain-containing protein [Sorangium sp. So ce131]|uniref:serine/threonine-protein kinase n=1 Tax=Sorangium sp. So ce131 TaxID=3133282 RepID=UPI003F621099
MSATLVDGTVFAHRYRVVRLLALGAMGSVYEAVHIETNRRRALKVMHAYLFQSEEMRDRFKREAQIAAEIESEYIVDVFDAGIDEATRMPFLVMELLRGEELGHRLKRLGRLPPTEVVTYLHQTALALDRTHAASIIHRDLKPDNLFVTLRDDGTPRMKILDFGVAKLIAEGATSAGATRSLGTPIYMAPEQFRVDTKLTGAVDIYALGMIAYTLLVGTPYWSREALSAGDVIAFALVAVHGPQESPVQRALAQGVALPPGFDAWFARATAVDPAARFRAATEAVQGLADALGVPVTGAPGRPPSAPAWPGASSFPATPAATPMPAMAPPAMATSAPPPVTPMRTTQPPATPMSATQPPVTPLAAAPAHITTPAPAPPAGAMHGPATSAGAMHGPGAPVATATVTNVALQGPEHPSRLQGAPLAATLMVTSVSSAQPAKPNRKPLVAAAAAAAGLGLLGVGGWLVLGPAAEPAPTATLDAGATNAAPPESAAAPPEAPSVPAPAAPTADAEPTPPEPSASAPAPSASATPSAPSTRGAPTTPARGAPTTPARGAPTTPARGAPTTPARGAPTTPARATSPARGAPKPAASGRKGTPTVPLLGRD